MAVDTEGAIGDAIERLRTQAGVVLVVVLALFSALRTAAGQDITRGVVESILEWLETAEWREDLAPEQLEAVESAERELEGVAADLPLALGLDPALAAVVWLVAYVLGLAAVVVAIDTFARERDVLSGLDTDRLGWKVLHLFLGTVAFGILIIVGFLLLVLPGLVVLLFLLFFPVAIVVDDESFFEAFASSVRVVREDVFGAIATLLVIFVAGIIVGIVSAVVQGALPAVPGALAGELLGATVLAFTLALLTRAYVDATSGEPAGAAPVGGPPSREEPAREDDRERRSDRGGEERRSDRDEGGRPSDRDAP